MSQEAIDQALEPQSGPTNLQMEAVAHTVRKIYKTERIIDFDLDFSKWKIKNLYGNTLWVQLLDEPDADTIVRNRIYLPVHQGKGQYRLGRVLKCGEETKYAKEGEYIRFPHGVGSAYETSIDGYKTWLLREDSVMMTVEFDGDEKDIKQHIEDTLIVPIK